MGSQAARSYRPAVRCFVALVWVVCGCGPPSWPEAAWSGEPARDEETRFSVEPAEPIAGEEVLATVPIANDGACHAFGATVRREPSEGRTLLVLEPSAPEMCAPAAISGGGSLVELGPLAGGADRVRAGELELSFVVRPRARSPGAPPLWWRAAHAVAEANHVHSACPRMEGMPPPRPWRLRAPRLHHQVAAAHPAWSEAEIEAAMCVAQSVEVRAVSARELRYRHSSSTLCHTAVSIGTVFVHEDGTLEVGEPWLLDGDDVPC